MDARPNPTTYPPTKPSPGSVGGCATSGPASSPTAAPGLGPVTPLPPVPGPSICGGTRGSSVTVATSQSDLLPPSTSCTSPTTPLSMPTTSDTDRRAEADDDRVIVPVALQAALLLTVTLDVAVDATGEVESEARSEALLSDARDEVDLVLLSAARALRDHLLVSGLATGLVVSRQVSGGQPELLLDRLPAEWREEQKNAGSC